MGTRVLALATVGTQDIQGELFEEFVERTVGPAAKVKARHIAALLADLPTEDLVDLLAGRSLRNGPCFDALDERYPGGWSLALLATDQPESVDSRYRDADTLPLAEVEAWYVRSTRPHVKLIEPIYRISVRPDVADEELASQIDRAVWDAVERTEPDVVVVLPVGGTPAMRLITERAASLHNAGAEVLRLMPDPDGGEVAQKSLLQLVDADLARRSFENQLSGALREARFAAARRLAEDAEALGLVRPSALVPWMVIAARIGEPSSEVVQAWVTRKERSVLDPKTCEELDEIWSEWSWRGRIQSRMALIDRIERDGRIADALIQAVSTAEAFPALWLEEKVGRNRQESVLDSPAACSLERPAPPPHELSPDSSITRVAAAVAWCVTRRSRCRTCPYNDRGLPETVKQLTGDVRGANIALALRSGALNWARNRLIHAFEAQDPEPPLQTDRTTLHRMNVSGTGETIADLLRAVFRELTGVAPRDPLDLVERQVESVLTQE